MQKTQHNRNGGNTMTLIGLLTTAALSFTLVAAVPAYAQEQRDQQEEQKAKPEENDKKVQPEKSAKPEAKPAVQQDKNNKPEEKNAKQEDNNTKPAEKNAQQHMQQAQPAEQAQRGGGQGGGRIPEEKFKANFGQQHTFRVSQSDYSNHRFQYGGYSFGFVDAWPSNWLYTQNVYVVEIDGVYYLCNASYPGVNLALSFTL
jgi:flagellar motor protein MotB